MMTMQSLIEIGVAGTIVNLLAAKALYWPDAKMLCVADAHFGKAAAYRALGQPVPGGTTAANLARLDGLLAAHDAQTIVFMGDLFHAKKSLTESVIGPMVEWRERHHNVDCVLVRGNHDRRAGALPESLRIETVTEPHCVGPFALCHEQLEHPTHHAIAGHIHPVFNLKGAARQSMRLPAFIFGARSTLLPAFGEFTGGFEVTPDADDDVFVTDGSRIWAVQPARRLRRFSRAAAE